MECDYKRALDLARGVHWDDAHEIVQPHTDSLSCLIHAYLHRVEGDLGNAGYWYRRAGERTPGNTLDEEFERLCAKAESGEAGHRV